MGKLWGAGPKSQEEIGLAMEETPAVGTYRKCLRYKTLTPIVEEYTDGSVVWCLKSQEPNRDLSFLMHLSIKYWRWSAN